MALISTKLITNEIPITHFWIMGWGWESHLEAFDKCVMVASSDFLLNSLEEYDKQEYIPFNRHTVLRTYDNDDGIVPDEV